jgi:hypothetical protein
MSTIKPQTSYNDITGAKLTTGGATDDYRSGWDRIFGKKEEPKEEPKVDQPEPEPELDAKATAKPPPV